MTSKSTSTPNSTSKTSEASPAHNPRKEAVTREAKPEDGHVVVEKDVKPSEATQKLAVASKPQSASQKPPLKKASKKDRSKKGGSQKAKSQKAKSQKAGSQKERAARAEVLAGLQNGNARVVYNADGDVAKIMLFDDPVNQALSDAVTEIVVHPQGNVDDARNWPDWEAALKLQIAKRLGLQSVFVKVEFSRTDEAGHPFANDQDVRITLRLSGQERSLILTDPTPED